MATPPPPEDPGYQPPPPPPPQYQTFGQPDVYGSSAARVAPLTSAVSVNGSAP